VTRPPQRIDHLVLAVHDLEDAADLYTRIGFQVGARNRHPWGTENRLIQFRSSFLELITVAEAGQVPPHAPGFFSFGAFVEDYLTKRERLAMLALDSSDAAADAAQFTREGIAGFPPFSFERTGRQPDGTQTRVAFSLAFARDDRRRLLRLPAAPSRSVLESAAPAPPEPRERDRSRDPGRGKPARPCRLPSRIHRRAAV
jgi:catechol 2,3-dioxygenase-like lactoylglutathione lyase family enzyme